MPSSTVTGLLQHISAAVTPVVLISACAALILGVNNKLSNLADRVRASAAEYRDKATLAERRSQLCAQIGILYRRFLLTWLALFALYGAVSAFTVMTLLILLTQRQMLSFDNGTLTLFMVGLVLMLAASILEIGEVALATRSLRVEIRDIPLGPTEGRGKPSPPAPLP
jgi:hypothetical protein